MKKNLNTKISSQYYMLKVLFKSGQYLYTLIQQKSTQIIVPAIISDYNEELDQYIRMFRNRLIAYAGIQKHIVVPKNARKQIFNGKKINLCIIQQKIIPLQFIMEKEMKTQLITHKKSQKIEDINQQKAQQNNKLFDQSQKTIKNQVIDDMELKIITIFQDIVRALYILHSNDIIHGRIAMNTIYGQIDQMSGSLKFYLNILDCISCFSKNYKFQFEQYIFRPQGQSFAYSQKQDLQSLIYVIIHLISNQNLFSLDNMKKQIRRDGPMIGKWKTCSFYKSMISILPDRLLFISDFYLYLKTLDINDKPNYAFWLKKTQAQHRAYLKMQYNKQSMSIMSTSNGKYCGKTINEQNQEDQKQTQNYIKTDLISNQNLEDQQNVPQQQNQIIENQKLSAKLFHLKQIWKNNKRSLMPENT